MPVGSQLVRSPMWDTLKRITLDDRHAARNRIISVARSDPASGAIDLLRTGILNAVEERRWRSLGITSPTTGCGKTFLAANLGFSFARQKHLRTLLFDMNLRNPDLARTLGISDAEAMVSALEGETQLEDRILRLSDNFAVGVNGTSTDTSAEILKSSVTDRVLSRTIEQLEPNVILYDLPAVLTSDDVLSFKHKLDAVILVVRGGHTTPGQVRDVENLLDGEIPILATVLNEAEHASDYVND